MISIYRDVAEARQSILARSFSLVTAVPPSVQKRLDEEFGQGATPETAVRTIISDIDRRGDCALQEWTRRLDQVTPSPLEVPLEELGAAVDRIPDQLRQALQAAADRIEAFHRLQPLPDWSTSSLGGIMGQRVLPIDTVGVYVPGGTAPLPSSLLMSVIPARVAGVRQIVVASPPTRPLGKLPDVILAAAQIAGVEKIFAMGGAQAIAALAIGTESIPAVDKIVGPGNLFVTLAKRQLYGFVGIDGLFGPTETVIVADENANGTWLAADLLAQAEHDLLATAILLTPSEAIIGEVVRALGQQIVSLPRADIIRSALADRGGLVKTSNLAEAISLANDFAPEHLCLSVANPRYWVNQVQHAGGIFLGESSFEVLGDYMAGPSHTMPTGGSARFASPLNVSDFVRISSIIQLDNLTAQQLSPMSALIAESESLSAHANAAWQRLNAIDQESLQ